MIFPDSAAGAASHEAEVVKTSGKLGWRHLQAKLYRFSPGEYEWKASPSHSLLVHIAGRARIGFRGGAKVEAGEAKSGLVWLTPAGRRNGGLQVVDGAAEMLLLLAPAAFMGEADPNDYGVTPEGFALVERDGISDPVIEAIARSILAELEAPDPMGALYADTVAATLSAYLLRRYATRLPETTPSSGAAPKLADPRLDRVIAFIDANLARELSLESLAREAGLSLYHFARAFKAATGVAPHRFVLKCRIDQARVLLPSADIPIATVAKLCGFASQAHLTHVFRRATGSTPGAYRHGARGPADPS
jgi:AraC family transcriptional regulator